MQLNNERPVFCVWACVSSMCVFVCFCLCFTSKLLVFVCNFACVSVSKSLLQHWHRPELAGKDLSKWVTFPTASPVVPNVMGSLSAHGHCYNSPATNYHRKPLNINAVEECSMSKPLRLQIHEAFKICETASCKQMKTNIINVLRRRRKPSQFTFQESRKAWRHVQICISDNLQIIFKGFNKDYIYTSILYLLQSYCL